MRNLSLFILALFCAIKLDAHIITVIANGYEGNYGIDEHLTIEPFVYGNNNFDIPTGINHFLNTGASVGSPGQGMNSYIYFDVNEDGTISNIRPAECATLSPGKDSLILQVVTITIHAGNYTGKYLPGFFKKNYKYVTGDLTVKLIKSQTYPITTSLECNIFNTYNYFYFNVNAKGRIKPHSSESITGKGKNLYFITRKLSPDVIAICPKCADIRISGYHDIPNSGRDLNLFEIRGITTSFYCYDEGPTFCKCVIF